MSQARIQNILACYFDRYRVVEKNGSIVLYIPEEFFYKRMVFFSLRQRLPWGFTLEIRYSLPWYRCRFKKKQWVTHYAGY